VLLLFCDRDLEINLMTWKLKGDLDILKIYPHTQNKAASVRHSKAGACIEKIQKCLKVKGQNVKFRITLGTIVTDIPIKPQQFPAIGFELRATTFSLP